MSTITCKSWMQSVIKPDEVSKYLKNGRSFVDEEQIGSLLQDKRHTGRSLIREILDKSLSLERLEPQETAALLQVDHEDTWGEIFDAAKQIRNKVYGPRIVTFAPLYCSNLCVNSCLYCAFRKENTSEKRRRLSVEEVRREAEALVSVGHKRLILVYGEHPASDIDYIVRTIQAVYDTRVGKGEIRRVNVNAAPQSIEDLKKLKDVGIGTFQVFQETYHQTTYERVHPRGIKADYLWRLYALHRAQDAGVDDVAIGALFGLYDWKFEVMGLLKHAIDLEERFGGVGPHTISFPRLEPASNTPFCTTSKYRLSDDEFRRVVAVIRVSVPYTGMIVTAREPREIRRQSVELGCTQTDASTRIGIGAYSEQYNEQEADRQQFLLGDTRSLDELVRELAEMGYLTSFCTAGYRCGRTGSHFMTIAKKGNVHLFCIPNAILTLKEFVLDYASPETRRACEELVARRIKHVPENIVPALRQRLEAIERGERDLRF